MVVHLGEYMAEPFSGFSQEYPGWIPKCLGDDHLDGAGDPLAKQDLIDGGDSASCHLCQLGLAQASISEKQHGIGVNEGFCLVHSSAPIRMIISAMNLATWGRTVGWNSASAASTSLTTRTCFGTETEGTA